MQLKTMRKLINQQDLIKWIAAMQDVHQFYKSTVWKHKRKEILRRDNFECQMCKKAGKYSGAVVVHHIKHLKDCPALALTDSNLISLCADCHNIVHPEKQKRWKKRTLLNEERW